MLFCGGQARLPCAHACKCPAERGQLQGKGAAGKLTHSNDTGGSAMNAPRLPWIHLTPEQKQRIPFGHGVSATLDSFVWYAPCGNAGFPPVTLSLLPCSQGNAGRTNALAGRRAETDSAPQTVRSRPTSRMHRQGNGWVFPDSFGAAAGV